ncbi:MAG: YCF48-related protein [Bacteroidales bacterium]|nr:YCF48-related protein [Bacteroidales bacterium]
MFRITTFLTVLILIAKSAMVCGQSFWTGQTSGTEAALYSIDFFDAASNMVGFVAGENGTILKTTDGGLTWTPCSTGTSETIYHVEAASTNQVFACGTNGIVLTSGDNGETWSQITIPSSLPGIQLDLHNISVNPLTGVGYVCGTEQNIHKTTDFGATWIPLREGYFGALYNVQTFGDDTMVFIGKNSIFASLIGRSFDGVRPLHGVIFILLTRIR